MCLYILDDSTELKRKARREGKKITAYKILKVRGNRLCSPYMGTRWLKNDTMVSNRKGKDPTRITKQEGQEGQVDKGLHFYSDFALACSQGINFDSYNRMCLYKVEIDPKDIIAFGSREVAAHKAKLIGLARKPTVTSFS